MGTRQGKLNFNKIVEPRKALRECNQTRHTEMKEQPLLGCDVLMCWLPLG